MAMQFSPLYHVLNLNARWSIDVRLNDVELARCFPCEADNPSHSQLHKSGSFDHMQDIHNHPANLAFNQSLIIEDVRRALMSSSLHGETFMHSNPFEFSDLAFINYRLFDTYLESDSRILYTHRVLA